MCAKLRQLADHCPDVRGTKVLKKKLKPTDDRESLVECDMPVRIVGGAFGKLDEVPLNGVATRDRLNGICHVGHLLEVVDNVHVETVAKKCCSQFAMTGTSRPAEARIDFHCEIAYHQSIRAPRY